MIVKHKAFLDRFNLVNHFKALKAVIDDHNDINYYLDCKTLNLYISADKNTYILYPLFIGMVVNKYAYLLELSDSVTNFAGWRPYKVQKVPFFADKVLFKSFLKKYGFKTPDYLIVNNKITKQNLFTDFIIKDRFSSFSEGIKGPYKDLFSYYLSDNSTQYLEKFLLGQIVKIWFWNNLPICLERKDMPTIKGDGICAIQELIIKQTLYKKHKWDEISELLQYYDKVLTTILDDGEEQLIDFRYNNKDAKLRNYEEAIFEVNEKAPLFYSLRKLGDLLYELLGQHEYSHLVYTVDAICDDTNELWYLEANANPAIHPQVYHQMINQYLFRCKKGVVA